MMLQLDYKVYNLLRTNQIGPATRRAPVPADSHSKVKSIPRVSRSAAARVAGADRVRGLINFEFVPSGKVHLNREAREHIIDFFK